MSAGTGQDQAGVGEAVLAATDAMRAALGAEQAVVLVSLNTDVVGHVPRGVRYLARAEVTRRTRTMAFVAAEVSGDGTPALSASGVFRLS